MGLTSETTRIVEEFEYNNVDLNKGVSEFLNQLGTLLFPLPASVDPQLILSQTKASGRMAPA